MLRVGLTGGLGSGKSTVAARLRSLGAHVAEADSLGRQLMQPGQPVYRAIVARFGPSVVLPDGQLDRATLARLAFDGNRLDELNAIIHPAVIAAQQQWAEAIFADDPAAVAVVESALVFEVERDARLRGETTGPLADWRRRFDRVLLVTAPEPLRIERYVRRILDSPSRPSAIADEAALQAAREAAVADARARMRRQMRDEEKIPLADFVLVNDGPLDALLAQTDILWKKLQAESAAHPVA